MRLFLLLLALVPCTALSETFLCIADAGTVVADGGGKPVTAGVADVSAKKYILTQENKKWVVKELGAAYVLFDDCTSPHFCQHSRGYTGTFLRTENGTFSITWMTMQKDGRDQWIVAKGRCSTI